MPSPQNLEFLQYQNAAAAPAPSEQVRTLLETFVPCPPLAMPNNNLGTDPKFSANAIWLTRAATTYAASVVRLKNAGLAASLDHLANQRCGPSTRSTAETMYRRIAAAFETLSPICGRADTCLPRSIAFKLLAQAKGLAPMLVFGVKRDPFAAHCWVQDGGIVLNDTVEHVRIYTPILIV